MDASIGEKKARSTFFARALLKTARTAGWITKWPPNNLAEFCSSNAAEKCCRFGKQKAPSKRVLVVSDREKVFRSKNCLDQKRSTPSHKAPIERPVFEHPIEIVGYMDNVGNRLDCISWVDSAASDCAALICDRLITNLSKWFAVV